MSSIELLAIVDVDVVPMDTEGVLPAQTVLIAGGRVVAMGPAQTIDVGQATVIDGTGLFLVPGLADMHVHLWGLGEDSLNLANGVTTVRNMWGDPVHLTWQRQIERGTRLGPRIITTTPPYGAVSSDGGNGGPAAPSLAGPEEAASMVAAVTKRGFQQIRVMPLLKPEMLRAIGEAATAAGVRVVGECPQSLSMEEASEAGMSCFEHLANVELGHVDPITGAVDSASVAKMARGFAEQGVWNCPTLVAHGHSPADHGPCADGMRYVRPGTKWHWQRLSEGQPAETAGDRAQMVEERHRHSEIVGLLHEQGAPLLAGTNAPNHYVVPGFGLHQELAHLVSAGLSPLEALKCATVNPARFMGEDDRGTVSAGAVADLVLVRRNPLEDLSALREIESVFVRGRHLARSELDALLEYEANHG